MNTHTKNSIQSSTHLKHLLEEQIHESWDELIDYLIKNNEIFRILKRLNQTSNIFPDPSVVFRAFSYPLDNLKVVILGQDPYPGKGNANGLAFAISETVKKVPPSLRNIENEIRDTHFKHYKDDYYYSTFFDHSLEGWAEQGVLLLNTALTVEEGIPNSHKKIWKDCINFVFSILDKKDLIYLLWGNNAKSYASKIKNENSVILECPHPSPLARGFKGSNHFILCNNELKKKEKKVIKWI